MPAFSLPPTSPFQELLEAIVTGNDTEFARWMGIHRERGQPPEGVPPLICAAVQHNREAIVRQFWPKAHDNTRHQAVAAGLEYVQPHLVRWMCQQSPIDLTRVMVCAAECGQVGAVEKLLAAQVPLYLRDTSQSAVARAAEHDQVEVMKKFEPFLTTHLSQQVIDHALCKGARSGSKGSVAILWPVASMTGQADALREAVLGGHLNLVLMVTENWTPVSTPQIKTACAKALSDLFDPRHDFNATHRAVFDRLLPWADANHQEAQPLRQAVAMGATDFIEPLLRVSDPDQARRAWTKQRPVPWELIIKLGHHVPPDTLQGWLKKDPGHLAELRASLRSSKAAASPVGANEHPRRPRVRC